MKHRVNITGILLANGKMAYYGEVVDDNQLISPETSIKDGFTVNNDDYEAAKKNKEIADKSASDLPPKADKGNKGA